MRTIALCLLLAGCAAQPVEPPKRHQLHVRPLCDGGGNFVGLQVATTGPGVWAFEFKPEDACDAGT